MFKKELISVVNFCYLVIVRVLKYFIVIPRVGAEGKEKQV